MRSTVRRVIVPGLMSLAFFASLHVGPASGETIVVNEDEDRSGISLSSQGPGGVEVRFGMDAFGLRPITIGGEPMKVVTLPGAILPNDAGAPNVPRMGRYIALPQAAGVTFEIISSRTRTYHDIEIAPAPVIPKENDDSPLVYEKDLAVYGRDALYPESPVELSVATKIRGVDAVVLGISPFQYNPVTKELIVHTELDVRVDFIGGNGHFGEDRLRSRHWEPVLRSHLMNYGSLPEIDMGAAVRDGYGYEYVIITPDHPDFIAWGDTLKSWRTLQGISTEVFTTADIGGTSWVDIYNWLYTAYRHWDVPPVAFLILGDYPESGDGRDSGITSPIWNSHCVSDNMYADVGAFDDLPDMAHGRIAARDASELGIMIGKMLSYERNPCIDPAFYDHPIVAGGWETDRWFILCSEVVHGFQEHILGKSPVREYAICAGYPDTLWSTHSNTPTIVGYFGPGGLGYIPQTPEHLTDWGANYARINSDINAGAFFMLHRDHGWTGGWGQPEYNTGHFWGLHNEAYPFVFSVNCLSGKYNHTVPSFTEAMHRMNHGALGLVAASEVSYSFVNDTFVWGMFDGLWPEFDPGYPSRERAADNTGGSDLKTAFAMASGKYYLSASNWPGSGGKEATYHLFHHHGGAFTQICSEVPEELTVIHDDICELFEDTFTVQADEGALIGLTVDGEIIGVADATGSPQQVPIIPQAEPGALRITVTKANRLRYDFTVPIAAGSLVVKPDGTGDYPTIQEAVDAATDGMIVLLDDGTFTGEGNRDIDYGGKSITVRSQSGDPSVCIIDCEGSEIEPHRGFSFHSGEDSTSVVELVMIVDGCAADGGGAHCVASSPSFIRSIFAGNCAVDQGGGIYLSGSSPRVMGCTIVANSAAGGGGGLACRNASSPVIGNTVIAFAARGEAIDCGPGSEPALSCCDLYGNAGGDWVGHIAGQYGLSGNIAEDPLFCDAAGGDYRIFNTSPCASAYSQGCGLMGALGVGCYQNLYVVRPDGTGHYPTIQDAIDAATAGYTIELADGVFTGEGNRDIDYHGKAITVRSQSGDPDACIIDCQGSAAGHHRGFYFGSGEGSDSVLEGVTIVNGYATEGGAIYCAHSGPTVRDCVFSGNSGFIMGGGLQCRYDSDVAVIGCEFRGNAASSGGGICIYETSQCVLDSCTFSGNSAATGAAVASWSSLPVIRNSTMYDNIASSCGGGVSFVDSGLTTMVVGCTFVGNAAPDGAAMGALTNSWPTVQNSIMAFGIGGAAVACSGGGGANLHCCDVYGNEGGDWVGCIAGQYGMNGNMGLDPLFCGEWNPERPYSLCSDSPCAPENNPECGLVGALDVGCGPSTRVPEGGADEPLVLSLERNVPNPFTPSTEIAYSVPAGAENDRVLLNIYDLSGRLVRTLVNAHESAGTYTVKWNGTDERGRAVASGIYFYSLSLGGRTEARRMVLLR